MTTEPFILPDHQHAQARDRMRQLVCERRDLGDPRQAEFDPREVARSVIWNLPGLIVCAGFVACFWWALS